MNYRKEIDGLRALAVIPVVLFHAGIELFSGGYIGVDVFFVISGYLITGILVSEMDNGSFSIVRFYERRARRILPALSVVMLATIPFALLWLTPGKLEAFAGSVISVVFFVSNFFFWSESGYFEASAEEKPLLHTWSLAVEEQYYIIFPLLLLLLWRMDKKHIGILLSIVFVASLALAEKSSKSEDSAAAFFLLPSRAWELMAGAMIAYLEFRSGPVQNSIKGSVLSLLGIVLVAASMLLFTHGTRHPSIYTLVPVLGTVLIIRYGRSPGPANLLLSNRGVVGIGLISYSLYLWHQPLFAFAHIRTLLDPPLWLMLILSMASVLLAFLSWRFVEQPFRTQRTGSFSRKAIFTYSGLAAATLSVVGILLIQFNGFPARYDPKILAISEIGLTNNPSRDTCFDRPADFYFTQEHIEKCTLGNKEHARALIWGDSHADAIAWETGLALGEINEGLLQTTDGGCAPIPGIKRGSCLPFNQNVSNHILSERSNTDIVIMHSRWTLNIERTKFNNGEGGIEGGNDFEAELHTVPEDYEDLPHHERLGRHINHYLNTLLEQGKKIILVYPVPEAGWQVPEYALKSQLFGNSNKDAFSELNGQKTISTSYATYQDRVARTHAILDELSHPNLYRVYPGEMLCDSFIKDRCLNSIGNTAYYIDDDHLSTPAVKLVAQEIQKMVKRIQAKETSVRLQNQ